ncbi:SNARE associated Golgi protein family [Quillaja saponaria]|uniref:SNARE associated Golgi protein family n=1 Tax=Quillaja saponaria TaxID=32244 RepID=A0AAD7P6R5_QUISA|nr:SNARE associated Golgi protein family [Quillaja saponaria]
MGFVKAVESKFLLSCWEMTAASTVVLGFLLGLIRVYLTMPESDYSFLKIPRSLMEQYSCHCLLEHYLESSEPLVFSLWPDKLKFFQAQLAKRRGGLLNYILFLRLTPTLPNTFINVASPIVDVPYHIFFLATFIGLIPVAFITVKAGVALGELQSLGDLYDFQSIATLFLIGVVSVTPTLMSKSKS